MTHAAFAQRAPLSGFLALFRHAGAALVASLVLIGACEAQEPATGTTTANDSGYREIVYGDPAAPVTIIEYASLTCGHCGAFHRERLPELKKEFLDTGKAKLVFRDFPLDNLALAAAMLPRCAPPGTEARLLSALFKNQQTWIMAEDKLAALKGFARLAGMTEADVDACLSNQALLDKMQSVFAEARNVHDVQATPTFYIGEEKISGNVDMDTFRDAIEAHLK